jgi:hypothetical protein
MLYDNFMNVDDYLVVMAYDNHIVFDTFACLAQDANLLMLINLRWLITCLIGACRLMSHLALLKAIACLVLVF